MATTNPLADVLAVLGISQTEIEKAVGKANVVAQAPKAEPKAAAKATMTAIERLWSLGTERDATRSGRSKRTLGVSDGIGDFAVIITKK